MSLPDVGQSIMLARELETALRLHRPEALAIIGCAGGNGFAEASSLGVSRLVGIDINPSYLAAAKQRYDGKFTSLELLPANIEDALPDIPEVDLVYAALVFEYVAIEKALPVLKAICRAGGQLVALLQLPTEGLSRVSASPYASLGGLKTIMNLVPPDEFVASARAAGFAIGSRHVVTLESSKQFLVQTLHLPS